ncbi:MAG: DUF3592 domain-containing protein [Verrucomicrobiae bacterium]|nr:DUF3592 domain-containing protein [Verrucomicrobiae bacterium]
MNRRSLAKQGDSKSGGGCLILFGLVFAGMGLLFSVFLVRQLIADASTYQWTETLCQIQSVEIAVESQRDDPFRLTARYTYQIEGTTHESDRVSLQEKWSDDYEKLALQQRDWLGKDGVVCYVNPANPAESILRREPLMNGLFILLPLVFVAVGVGIVWLGIHTLRAKKRASLAGSAASLSGSLSKNPSGGRKAAMIFGLVFALVGAGVGVPMMLGPIQKMVGSRHWVATPCTVIWSRVLSHDSDDGTTYSVDIFYEYEFAGQKHRSNRYQFLSGSSSGRSGKAAVVRQFPAGSRQVCYVNPEIPEQAVIRPGITPMIFIALIPLVFLLVGLTVFWGAIRSGRKGPLGHRDAKPVATSLFSAEVAQSGEALVLAPGGSRTMKAGGCLIAALFWNGIVAVFLNEVIDGWKHGGVDWFLTLFLIPFVVIGAGLILGFFYQLLSLANPKPSLVLPGGPPRVGETLEVRWELQGRTSRVTRLTISLWGIESATYRRGTDTTTSHEVFLDLPIAEAVDEMDIRQGRAQVMLPDDLMISLKLPNNEIKYELRVSGDIPLWPDISDQYDLTLLPRRDNPV